MPSWMWRHSLALALSCALTNLMWARKENPLDRLTPVPANQPIPVVDFFRPPYCQTPDLNPAGTHFAAKVSGRNGQIDLLVYDIAAQKYERTGGGDDDDIASVAWLTDQRVLFSLTKDKIYAYGLFASDVGSLKHANALELYSGVSLVAIPHNDRLHPILWLRRDATNDFQDSGAIQIDASRHLALRPAVGLSACMQTRFPRPETGATQAYLPNGRGELHYAITSKDGIFTLLRLENDRWQPTAVDLTHYAVAAPGIGDDELIVRAHHERAPDSLCRLDVKTGQILGTLYQDERYDLRGLHLVRGPEDKEIVGLSYQQTLPCTVWFDPELKTLQKSLEAALPQVAVQITDWDKTRSRFFLATFSDRQPAQFFQYDRLTNSIVPLVKTRPWIDPGRMQTMRGLSYPTRDHHEIEAYLTLPAGASKDNPPPLVVLPHAGPWTRNIWTWNPEVQFLASRGYAVLQPNYRGSAGYDWKFAESDHWDFRKMHDDVTDGVRALIRTGLVDSKRVAIMGEGFGGYLALCGAAYEPGLYRCAITIAGVFDWERMMNEVRREDPDESHYGTLRHFLGDPRLTQERFDAISPVRHVDQIKIPVFVAHGAEDPVASVAQSQHLISELRQHNVSVEQQIEYGEGHGFSQLDHKVRFYTGIEAFLAKHLAPTTTVTRVPK